MGFRQKNVVKNIANAIFPVKCRGCGETGGYLCERCKKYISENMQGRNALCLETSNSSDALIMGEARGLFKKVEFLGFRDEILGELIEECKYGPARGLVPEIAEVVFRGYFMGGEQVILVPMPTSRKHVRERGFDHMDLIAKYIENESAGLIRRIRLLERAKDTVQVGATGKVRRIQAKEAVKLNAKYYNSEGQINSEFRGVKVVLFDDVWTTGASIVEAGKLLKKAGIDSLSALTITKNRARKSPVIRHGEID